MTDNKPIYIMTDIHLLLHKLKDDRPKLKGRSFIRFSKKVCNW